MIRELIDAITGGREIETQEHGIDTFNDSEIHAMDDSAVIPRFFNSIGEECQRVPDGTWIRKTDYNPLDY